MNKEKPQFERQIKEIIKQVYNDRIGEDWAARAAAKINHLSSTQVHQARQETDAISYTQGVLDGKKKVAREIFEEFEKLASTHSLWRTIDIDKDDWQSLKSKYMEGK